MSDTQLIDFLESHRYEVWETMYGWRVMGRDAHETKGYSSEWREAVEDAARKETKAA